MSHDTSCQTVIKCPLLDGKPCMWGECASYEKYVDTVKYYDMRRVIPDDEKYDWVESKSWIGTTKTKKLKKGFWKYLSSYRYHNCLAVDTTYHRCLHLNSVLKIETDERQIDETHVSTSTYMEHLSVEKYNSSHTTKTGEEDG